MSLLVFILSSLLAFCFYRIFSISKENKKNYKFFQLVETSPDGFRVIENGLMTYANRRFCEMTGYSKDELFSKPFELIFSAESLPTVKENIKLRSKLLSSSYEAELMRKDGVKVPVIVSGQPIIDQSGTWIGNCGVFTDITELKNVQADLRIAEQRLFHSQKLEALGQLSGGIAHDFNNLLAVILGNLEILNERFTAVEGASKYITRAIQGARRASSLTRRLLAFSRKQGLSSKSTDIRGLILGMMDLLTGSVGESISIILNLPKGLWYATVDSGQLEAVLINLVVNSRDAMPNGGKIFLECENRNFTHNDDLVISKNIMPGDYLIISVKDSGEGIPPEVIPKIFEPFFTTKGVGKGSGLGMSIAYGFAKESNGFLDVRSKLGEGTLVSLYLPRATELPLPVNPDSDGLSPYRGNGENILVVEDDDEVRKLVENMLDFLGYKVFSAHDASSAKTMIDKVLDFDLLLVDVVLPDASGAEIAMETKYSNKTIYMSGYTDLGGVSRLSEKDRIDLLNKPFKMVELAQRVRAKLEVN